MGYTHYLRTNAPIPSSVFTDAKLLIDEARTRGIVITGWDGTGEPTIDESGLRLNGDASQDLDHETFLLDGIDGFSFCKTARKPYDAVVCAILLRLAEAVPSAEVSSDGDWDDWAPGRDLYLATFKTEAEKPRGIR